MRDLTPTQAAYWSAGHASAAPDAVTAHLYAEFDTGPLDPDRLSAAVQALFDRHPMLRLSVARDGTAEIVPRGVQHALDIADLHRAAPRDVERCLDESRHARSHQRLRIETGQGAEIGLTRLPGDRARLHVDIDMIAADPSCWGTVLSDLARLYRGDLDPSATVPPVPVPEAAADRAVHRDWWRQRIDTLPPPPVLPAPRRGDGPASTRLAATLTAAERAGLANAARRAGVTPSTLALALFATALGAETGQDSFRLTLPVFQRPEGTDGIGDTSELTLIPVALDPRADLATLARRLWSDMAAGLSHLACPGVEIMRDLARRDRAAGIAPVVFTAGLDVPGGSILPEPARALFGDPVWCVSQGPGVALDAQIAALGDGVLVNWDLRLDLVREDRARALFDAYVATLRAVAADPATLDRSIAAWQGRPEETPLSDLQKAYLLGRSDHMPLGGIAMQETRLYRGTADLANLRRRLRELTARHPALRTTIDETRLVARIADRADPPVEETDLRDLPPDEAESRLAALTDRIAQTSAPLDTPPWLVHAVHMPEGARDPLAVIARFDAQILDGQGIARVLAALFGADLDDTAESPPAPTPDRAADEAYWTEKLAPVTGPPQLPWKAPLGEIGTSRYRRKSLYVPRSLRKRLEKAGAKAGLFRNAAIAAPVLEALARWTPDLDLCVGVPVAPGSGGTLANGSSFLAVRYAVTGAPLADRAAAFQTDILEGLAHPGFSGIDIARALVSRNGGGVALPVVLTNCLGWPDAPEDGGMRLDRGLTRTPQCALDIRLADGAGGGLRIDADFAEEALEPATIRAILAAIGRALRQVARSGAFDLDGDLILPKAHLAGPIAPGEVDASGFLERIAARLFDNPSDATALVCGGTRLSEARLGRKVAKAIAGLRARGLRKGDVVALCLPRGVEHVVLGLACALEGLVRVPVDAGAPPDRLAFLLDTCRPALVVATDALPDRPSATPADLMAEDAPEGRPVTPATLQDRSESPAPAYYLFTSGTTGRPKCVVLSNRATSNTLGHTLAHWRMGARDALLSVTPYHHDMSVFDVFGTLAAGGRLILPAPDEEKDAAAWARLVRDEGVTLWVSVPAILEMLLTAADPTNLASLRLVAQGGDYIKRRSIETLERHLPEARLFSLGGPTETTIWSIWHEIGPGDREVIPYGRALPGTRQVVLNPLGEPCPPGVIGRIHTTGANVALGYLDGDRIGGDDFTTLPAHTGPAFRTGDLGRHRPDGTLIFAGRVGGYVKVRGVRVSLPDIEDELSAQEGVTGVIVVDLPEPATGDSVLAALYTARSGIPAADLRAFAAGRLSPSHLPSRYSRVEALPLSPNGKPDRARARTLLAGDAPGPAAPTPDSARILAIYGDATGRDPDPGTGFLALGLRPDHLPPIAAALNAAFGAALTPRDLIACATPGDVAARLAARS